MATIDAASKPLRMVPIKHYFRFAARQVLWVDISHKCFLGNPSSKIGLRSYIYLAFHAQQDYSR